MMNCLVPLTVAPLILVASTVAPLAQQTCPVFSNEPDHYECSTYNPAGQLLPQPPYPLKLKMGTVDGALSYAMKFSGDERTVVVGRPIQKNADTQITSTCGYVQSMKTKQMFPTMSMRTLDRTGTLVSETQFRAENKSVTLLTYGPKGSDGGLIGRSVCRPKYVTPTPAPARPSVPPPAR